MVSISDLPVETLLNIFKLIYGNDTESDDSGDDDDYEEESSESSSWTEDDLHSPTFFPMAVAYVCRHWRDILARSPKYWNRVVFEVSRDPTPLLDAFSWSNDQLLDVLVWNRIQDLTPAGKALENERVSTITESLTPHFHRCYRISYEVTYASSLPPITAILKTSPYCLNQFVFESRVDDIPYDRPNNLSVMPVGLNVVSFSDLAVLSLGARQFIDLGRAYPNWLHEFRSNSYLTLTISQFRFQQKKDGDDERYTLFEFLSHLAAMPRAGTLRLRDLSLAYEPELPIKDSGFINPTSLFLDNLGENFLFEFFKGIRLSCQKLYIDRCAIPCVDRLEAGHPHLHLANLGYTHNIHNILSAWHGSHLSLYSCPSFDDDLVDRLNDEGRNRYLELLTLLMVIDCINFTSAGLRKLITIQEAEVAHHNSLYKVLDRVYVEGGRLSLCEEDIRWFREHGDQTDVSWTIVHPDGTYSYPLKHYRLEED